MVNLQIRLHLQASIDPTQCGIFMTDLSAAVCEFFLNVAITKIHQVPSSVLGVGHLVAATSIDVPSLTGVGTHAALGQLVAGFCSNFNSQPCAQHLQVTLICYLTWVAVSVPGELVRTASPGS